MKIAPTHLSFWKMAITSMFGSAYLSFVGVATNYGFQTGFFSHWLRTFRITIVPLLVILRPYVQRLLHEMTE